MAFPNLASAITFFDSAECTLPKKELSPPEYVPFLVLLIFSFATTECIFPRVEPAVGQIL
jgi:hypothetical protein